MYKLNRRIFVSIFILVLLASTVGAQTWTKDLAKGVTLTQIVKSPDGKTIPRIINVVKVDPKAPGMKIKMALAGDVIWDTDATSGRETMGSIAKRIHATAVVNTDFCDWTGDPLGLHISGGEFMSEPYKGRTMFGITSDGKYLFDRLEFDARLTLPGGKWFPIRGINRPRGQNELIAYTSAFFKSTCTKPNGSEVIVTTSDLPVRLGVPIKGTVTKALPDQCDTAIPSGGIILSGAGTASDFIKESLKEGATVTIQFDVKGESTTGWEKVVEATGGTPRLIRNGKISVELAQENLKPTATFNIVTHPRSALGVTRDGKLILVTVDGRQTVSTGMSLKDLAQFMLSQGCVEAMNMDGGGSTTLAAWHGAINSPSDGNQRMLPNGIAVFADESSPDDIPEFTISPLPGSLTSGTTAQLSLLDASSQPLKPELAKKAIWSMTGRTNFVDQSGKIYALKAGQTEVVAKIGTRTASIKIETIPAPPTRIVVLFARKTDADPPNRDTLNIILSDLNLNGYSGKQVSVKVTGGTADQSELTTGANGTASTGITWDGTGGKVIATSGELKSVVLDQPK